MQPPTLAISNAADDTAVLLGRNDGTGTAAGQAQIVAYIQFNTEAPTGQMYLGPFLPVVPGNDMHLGCFLQVVPGNDMQLGASLHVVPGDDMH